ncbi:hypothetical protein FB567DRAFT_612457 [Paraphoma chrysanthemicola]|uniref:Uncharacterized protein n=1 Tax=Paraphoma chrysanthemicola TaxID=798071 RepID=A0A8K0QWC0_9PLEO|nr:hypothetical protein FB567DRAFT_612457 [Paraphoma chrysanthemicola]
MAEDLFKLVLIRPPLTPDPRYPPIRLTQETPFQLLLGARASANPNDPRKSLEDASSDYINDPAEFVSLGSSDDALSRLDAAGSALDELETESVKTAAEFPEETATSGASPASGAGDGPQSTAEHEDVDHAELLAKLKAVLEQDDLVQAVSSFSSLEKRLKDSIIALRLLGIEQSTGNLAKLTRRLRVLGVLRKTSNDTSFPLNQDDLRKYDLRPLLVPTFAELKSILSSAAARKEAEGVAQAAIVAAQARIDRLWDNRLKIAAGIKNIVKLPPKYRQYIEPIKFDPEAPAADLTHYNLAQQHLQLASNLTKLTLTSFEHNLGARTHTIPRVLAATAPTAEATSAASFTPELTAASAAAISNPLVNMTKNLLDSLSTIAPQPRKLPSFEMPNVIPFALKTDAPLLDTTRSILKDYNIDASGKPVDQVVHSVQQLLKSNANELDDEYNAYNSQVAKIQYVGGLKVQYAKPDLSRWAGAFAKGSLKAPPLITTLPSFLRPAGRVTILGVADLLVVKQQLIGYEGGDIAYIENLLKGEKKKREVGTLTSQSTEVTTEVETTESMEIDNTTAERFEVSSESTKSIKEDQSVKAGVTVSASYGPTVSISANASYANDRSQSESTKAASRYSKDVTTKAVEKISKRVLQRTVTKLLTQTTTSDVHELSNPGGTNISGVYEAQVWNYGKRTMLDFMIPEPGAFYLDKQTDPHESANTLMAVPPFKTAPRDLDAETAMKFGVQYGVTDLDLPPPEMSRASASYAAGKDEPHSKADKITIAVGFQVTGISVTATGVSQIDKNQNAVIVTCGAFKWGWDPSKQVIGTVTTTTDYIVFKDVDVTTIYGQGTFGNVGEANQKQVKKEQGEIPWSVTAAYMDNFAITIELFLERTDEAYHNWQNKSWAKLKSAADKLIADQQATIQKAKYNSAFQGRNPDKNKIVMRNEMKKNCISIMMDSHFDEFGANNIIQPSRIKAVPGDLPMSEINIDMAWERGGFVRFFEEAFEWEEMTWMLYPYFWGRKDHWYRRVDYEDEDPEFEKFIQSGFARANVPVRPGFEGALEHFLATGKVWNGGPLPGLSSETFLPLATEIQESLGKKKDEPTKYGEPWLVRVPTNLIKLRNDNKAPVWTKDVRTENWTETPDSS